MALDKMIADYNSENGPIPSVDSADLGKVWAVQRDARSRFPGQKILADADDWEQVCSPDVDLFAIWYRMAMLEMLAEHGVLSPWLHDGELNDAVFRVFATFPVKRIPKGGQEGYPFDVQRLVKQIEEEAA